MKLLTYTVALDAKGTGLFPAMARMLYASWNLSGNHGDFCIVSDKLSPPPAGQDSKLRIVAPPPGTPPYQAKALAWQWIPWREYDAVLYVDADCLFLRPLVLPDQPWDLLVQEGSGRSMTTQYYNSWLTEKEMTACAGRRGINSGTFAAKAELFEKVCREWLAVLASTPPRPVWRTGCDQAAWNRVVLDREQLHAVRRFREGTVGFPFLKHDPVRLLESTLLHFAAVGPERAFAAMFDCFFDRFSCVCE
jgi:hypothetical protein